MKINGFKRFLLIAIAAVMVFSLFACGETPKETEDTSKEEIENPTESSDTKPRDSEEVEHPVNTESSENQGGEGSESQETVPGETVLGETTETTETESQETVPDETTESESAELVETTETESQETIPDETTESAETTETETETETEKPECPHTELTEVASKAATCTEAGNEAYKACVCGKFILADGTLADAAPVIPVVDHVMDEGKITTPATCIAKGVKTYTCTFGCGETTTEEVAVDPTNHVSETEVIKCVVSCAGCKTAVDGADKQHGEIKTNKQAEAICTVCGDNFGLSDTIFGANGFDAYFDAKHFNSSNSNLDMGVLSEDKTSVRYEGTGNNWEIYPTIFQNGANDVAMGRYLVVKYKTNITSTNYNNIQIYISSVIDDANGTATKSIAMIKDEQWHIGVIDLHKDDYAPDGAGKYIPKLLRIDVVDPVNAAANHEKLPTVQWVDIAFFALCDDAADIKNYLTVNDATALCDHNERVKDENCNEYCLACGKIFGTNHKNVAETYTDDPVTNLRTYSAKCADCKKSVYSYSVQMGAEKPNVFVAASGLAEMKNPFQMGGAELASDGSYVTFRNDPTASQNGGEGYFYVIENGEATEATGQYIMIKYRTTYEERWGFHIGANTVKTSPFGSTTVDGVEYSDSFSIALRGGVGTRTYGAIIADGEWHVMILDMAKINTWNGFNPEEDGSYLLDYLRFDIFDVKSAENRTTDIAFIAIADSIEKLCPLGGLTDVTLVNGFGGNALSEPMNGFTGNNYFDAKYLKDTGNFGVTLEKDAAHGNMPYAQFTIPGGNSDAYFNLWSNDTATTKAGAYIGVLYRYPTTGSYLDFFINSTKTGADSKSEKNCEGLTADNNWRIAFVDLTSLNHPETLDDGGNPVYYDPEKGFKSLRFDVFNSEHEADVNVDIAFIAFFDNQEEAEAYFAAYLKAYSIECRHDISEGVYVSDDDPDTFAALWGKNCPVCDKELGTVTAPHVINVENVGGLFDKALGKTTKVFVFKPGNTYYPEEGYITPDADGRLLIKGWGGAYGTISTVSYRVLDAEGKVLKTWTTAGATLSAEADVWKEVQGSIPYSTAVRIQVYADLSDASLLGKTVTVECAYVPEEATGDDKYITFAVVEGVKVECSHKNMEYTPTDDVITYNASCADCGYKGTVTGINQEGLTVLDADDMVSVGRTLEAVSGGTPIGTLTSETDDFYNDMPYMRMLVTRDSEASQSHILLEFEEKVQNVGKYVAIIYRSQSIYCANIYISSTGSVSANQNVETATPTWNSSNDNGWSLSVYDFSARENWSNETGIGCIRIDFWKNRQETDEVSYLVPGNFVDIAYVGFFNSQAEAEAFYAAATEQYNLDEMYRMTVNSFTVGGENLGSNVGVGRAINYDLSGKTVTDAATAIQFGGWFMNREGTAAYKCRIIGNTTVEKDLGAGGTKTPGVGDGDTYLGIAERLGLDATALNGVTCSRTLDLTGFEGQTVTVEFVAVTPSGKEIVAMTITNVTVPETDAQ